MSKNLLIIESPNKIQTISKFLGSDYKIIATVGHIRDLSVRNGYDPKTLEPNWTIPGLKKKHGPLERAKKEIIAEIKAEASKADNVYIATDPDREGEAIAWHVFEVLDKKDQEKVKRITFNEITKPAIVQALENPRDIDIKWVHSQFARRIIDRMVGFGLSKLLRTKLHAKSAGRVQTIALKFIYDREQLIKKFKETKTWTLDITLKDGADISLRQINPKLTGIKSNITTDEDKTTTGVVIFNELASANKVKDDLGKDFTIYQIDPPQLVVRNPKEPFKTSTLQQAGIGQLGWNVGKVTSVAQHLYEGINIKGEHTALISYPRTDSIRIAETFVAKLKEFISQEYSSKDFRYKEYVATKKGKAPAEENVQDAHEGIRVIDPFLTPEKLGELLGHNSDEYKLYKLIWVRTVAAFMQPAKYERVIVRLENNNNKFFAHNTKITYKGWMEVDKWTKSENEVDIKLHTLKNGLKFAAKTVEVTEHISAPPPRFNQATLIKELDESGVGRPSTYKTMVDKSLERGYTRTEGRAFVMQPLGNEVIEELSKYFPFVVDVDFTSEMEDHLDRIAHKSENWKKWILEDISPQLNKELKKADKEMEVVQPRQVGRNCPECGEPLIYRISKKTGKEFIGCSAFPKCHYAEFPGYVPPKELVEKCPICGAHLVERQNKRGQIFIGCSAYPKCHYMRNANQTAEEAEAAAKLKAEKIARGELSPNGRPIKKTKKGT